MSKRLLPWATLLLIPAAVSALLLWFHIPAVLLLCALMALALTLTHVLGLDILTAYLATSPGGTGHRAFYFAACGQRGSGAGEIVLARRPGLKDYAFSASRAAV